MFVIRVDDGSGPRVVVTRPWTVRQLELRNKTKLSKLRDAGIGMDDFMWLAWRQLTDDGLLDVSFEDYGQSLRVCEPLDENDEGHPQNPTKTAPSAG